MSTVTELPTTPDDQAATAPAQKRQRSAFTLGAVIEALPGAFKKLDPRTMWRNPVMFLVEVGAVLVTALAIAEPFLGGPAPSGGAAIPASFAWGIAVWLWLTVLFANLAESVAEGRGKAQAESLRATRTSTIAHRVAGYDSAADPSAASAQLEEIASSELGLHDTVVVSAGELVPGDVTTLLLDKTGTITYGNRQASEFIALDGIEEKELMTLAALSSLADPTPEGKSIVDLARRQGVQFDENAAGEIVPFTAQTRMSGLDLRNGVQIRKGAGSAVTAWVRQDQPPAEAVLAELRSMGIRTVMITGDNPLTARAIAAEAGVDDFLAEATPEGKMALIKREQAGGSLVALTGDGTNDAPALAQADVGVAMNTGTSAAKEAGNMVDLDSDPTKLIDIVAIGKQLLITRGALTTFSIANDLAKYFAIIPAMFVGVFPGLAVLNIMGLHSPASAVLSAIIFNAIIIVILIPLALRGVKYRPLSSSRVLGRNLLVYGLGGVIAPFIGIKLIDLLVSLLPGF